MKKIIALLITIALSTSVYAQGPVKLLKGQTYTATEDSWVFSVDEEQQIRSGLIELDFTKKQVVLLQANINILNSQIGTYQQMSDKYRAAWIASDEDLTKTLQTQNRSKMLYLLMGIGLTVAAGAAMSHAN